MKSIDPKYDSLQPAPHGETACRRELSVVMASRLDAMAAPGGGEVQMLATAESLRSVSVVGRPWRPWEDSLADVDCLHLFGSSREHLFVVEAARRHNTRIVLSPITWFDWINCWREPESLTKRLAACARYAVRAAMPKIPSWRRRLYHSVDLLLPNSNAEARQLMELFDVAPDRIHIVPNGADPRFAQGMPEPFGCLTGGTGFVLCAGRIEPRKNQLQLIRSLRGAGVQLVILGDVVPGHESYLADCAREADSHVQFIPRLDHGDTLLADAYAACGCLALTSWFETPGLVALEAAMQGTPLVLPAGGCAEEYFGPMATYVNPNDLPGIRRAVLEAVNCPRSSELAQIVQTCYSWNAAAAATREAYERIL